MQPIALPIAMKAVAKEEADAFEILPGSAEGGLVLLCDHASNRLPDGYGTLGLAHSEFKRHIAYDIGAGPITRRLSELLGVPAVMTRYSRLLIDCNRGLDDPTLVMRLSDGAVVPGNRKLDPQERERRIALYYAPYHSAIDRVLQQCFAVGATPMLVSVHSYTPMWKGVPRPWHAGVLWDRDDRVARPLIEALAADTARLVIGDNEPYSGRLRGDTMWKHGTMRGIAHAIIEVRQDLVESDAGVVEWSDRLARILTEMLSCPVKGPELRTVRHYGSHTD